MPVGRDMPLEVGGGDCHRTQKGEGEIELE